MVSNNAPPKPVSEVGRVESVASEICMVSGLSQIALNNVVEFSSGARGLVLGFTKHEAQVIVLGDYFHIVKGELVRVIADGWKVNTSQQLLGRVINPLGKPMDGLADIPESSSSRYFESQAKPVSQRTYITEPLYTGFVCVDSQVPVGLGQRELLVGSKKVGMIDLAIEAMCHQHTQSTKVVNIYVAIDSDSAATKRRISRLKETGALARSVVIVGRSSDPASLNYIAPMVGVTIAEAYAEQDKDVLLVIDNMTSHAKVYRQISLLLGRPAGREAYPGDIFYLHARLLERCGAFSDSAGGGSITALPIVETQSEEITDYITTNLMSITDGHILFRQSLANKGVQPAVDSGFSVSRIGGRAQIPLMRYLSDELKQLTIQFAEVERYLVFGTELRDEMQELVDLSRRFQRLFNQNFHEALPAYHQIVLIFAIVFKHILYWDEHQIVLVRSQLIQFLQQPGIKEELELACQQEDPQQAMPILDKLIQKFKQDPTTITPAEKKQPSQAEKETIIDLLRDNQSAYATREPKE